jgi:hypothetical protein
MAGGAISGSVKNFFAIFAYNEQKKLFSVDKLTAD